MTRNSTLFLFTLIFFASLTAQKPTKKHDGPSVDKELIKLSDALKLSDAQILKLRPILDNYANEHKQLREAQMKLQKRKLAEIQQNLTKEQKEAFLKMTKMRMEKRHQGVDKKRGEFKQLLDKLDLSESQKKQLELTTEPINKQFKEDLSKAETKDDKKELFKAHKKLLKEALDKVLTDQQKENLEKIKAKHEKRKN